MIDNGKKFISNLIANAEKDEPGQRPQSNESDVQIPGSQVSPKYIIGNKQFDNETYQKLSQEQEDNIYHLAKRHHKLGIDPEITREQVKRITGADVNDATIDFILRTGIPPRTKKSIKRIKQDDIIKK